uniref:Glutathione S-transferase omega 2 n=1 Tax=Ostrinia furnacalis TaxID=93504 RepID=A0A6C0W870_OSTFU|nr:glutathione S-transferase omega 2 [Ostrinia furnacalis]
MIASTISLASHILVSSFKLLTPVTQALEYVVPYFSMSPKIDFNSKHLAKGDPLPPYNGKLRVYNMRFCPYAQRTILALNAKQVDYEVVNIDLVNKPEWLFKKSGFGKVPAIEVKEDVCIYESLVTVELIDELYPQRPLISKDPIRKAFDKIIIEALGPVQVLMFKAFKFPDTITDDMVAAYNKALAFFQEQLQSRGTQFLAGSEPGFVDYMIWPWFERILCVQDMKPLVIDANKYKLLLDYLDLMLKDPAVSQYVIPKDVLLKFLEGYRTGQIDYDSYFNPVKSNI